MHTYIPKCMLALFTKTSPYCHTYNVSSFTERMEEGTILGNTVEACIVEPAEECSSVIGTVTTVRQISTPQEHNCWKKLRESISEPDSG